MLALSPQSDPKADAEEMLRAAATPRRRRWI
jgi:hypothetical protein